MTTLKTAKALKKLSSILLAIILLMQNIIFLPSYTSAQESGSGTEKILEENTKENTEKIQSFPDVKTSHEFYEAIKYAKENNIAQGYPDGTFGPDNRVNRAEFLKIAIKGANISIGDNEENNYQDCFPDVQDQWFSSFVCIAKEKGWISGDGKDGKFHPERNVNLAESLKMILTTNDFEIDESEGDNWYEAYFRIANIGDIYDKAKNKTTNYEITRGEMVDFVYQMVQWKNKKYDELYKRESFEYIQESLMNIENKQEKLNKLSKELNEEFIQDGSEIRVVSMTYKNGNLDILLDMVPRRELLESPDGTAYVDTFLIEKAPEVYYKANRIFIHFIKK